jgi:hypothetical protein
MEEIENEIW